MVLARPSPNNVGVAPVALGWGCRRAWMVAQINRVRRENDLTKVVFKRKVVLKTTARASRLDAHAVTGPV